MSGYTVTIIPSDGRPGPRTTITVDTTDGAPRVRELTVESDGADLSASGVPAIDLPQLIAAFSRPATQVRADAPPARASRRTAPVNGNAVRGARTAAKTVSNSLMPAKAVRRRRHTAGEEFPAATPPQPKPQYRRMPDPADVIAAWRKVRRRT